MKKNDFITVIRVFAALAVWFLITKSYAAFVDPLLTGKFPETVRMIISSMIIPYTLGMGAAYLILRGMRNQESKSTEVPGMYDQPVTPGLMIKSFLIQTGLSMPVILILNIINILVLRNTPHAMTADQIFGKYMIFYLVLLLIFNPVMEEVLFRKLFLDRLLVIGETGAVIISAVLFGLPHAYSQGVPQMFGTFIIGLVWAYVRVKTGKLWPCVILHMMFNLYGCYFSTLMNRAQGTRVMFMFISIIVMPIIAVILLIKNRNSKAAAATVVSDVNA